MINRFPKIFVHSQVKGNFYKFKNLNLKGAIKVKTKKMKRSIKTKSIINKQMLESSYYSLVLEENIVVLGSFLVKHFQVLLLNHLHFNKVICVPFKFEKR